MRQWYYVRQGDRFGPVSEQALLELLRQGTVRPDDLVWTDGMADWARADTIPEFAAALGQGPPPQAVTPPEYASLPREPLLPHRGGAILTLGILGVVCCFILGIIAWVMGSGDLKDMRAGRRDPSGRGLTQAGHILGIIGTVLGILKMVGWAVWWGAGDHEAYVRGPFLFPLFP